MRKADLQKLIQEQKKLEEKISTERHKLKVLKKKFREEYRKREAQFLIAVGRTVLKYGEVIEVNGEKIIALPIDTEPLIETFTKHKDFIAISDFSEWLEKIEITANARARAR